MPEGGARFSVDAQVRCGGYLDEDTQSLQNVAYATTGQPERLTN
jgi:hypothetical protein